MICLEPFGSSWGDCPFRLPDARKGAWSDQVPLPILFKSDAAVWKRSFAESCSKAKNISPKDHLNTRMLQTMVSGWAAVLRGGR